MLFALLGIFGLLMLVLVGASIWMMAQMRGEMRDRERAQLRALSELHNALTMRIAEQTRTQQKMLHGLQQQLLVRFSRLYQALERRFGEMQRDLTEESGRLRIDLLTRVDGLQKGIMETLADGQAAQQERLVTLRDAVSEHLGRYREAFDEHQRHVLQSQQTALQTGMADVRRQVNEALARHAETLGARVEGLTRTTEERLREISGQVDKRLNEGFEKTTATFTQVLNHLTRIDEAQKRITELSSNVVSLQEVLSDKRSRGAFGEVQLAALVRNVMPERSFALQHTLANGTRADCMLFMPQPTGSVAVDAKFPLESYRRMTDVDLPAAERNRAAGAFRKDIRRHIEDIAGKYIVEGETADGAMMFIPAEAVFAEIHARFPELVERAYRRRVWMVSPTTMMAILTTARAVLKDAATREQVDIIQQHLHALSKDFGRFQERMDRLAGHIRQAHKDADEVGISARRITGRFEKIEQVELDEFPEGGLPVFKKGR